MGKYSWQLAAGSGQQDETGTRRNGETEIRGQKDNAHCAFINYDLAFCSNVLLIVICNFSMLSADCETGDPTVRLGTERSAASAKKCEM